MITVNHNGQMYRTTNSGTQPINIGEVTERELFLFMASKLSSIRAMVLFFTVLAIIGLVSSFIAIALALSK